MSEVAVEQEVATFYSWLGHDETGRAMPSGQIIRISGGESRRGNDGEKIRVPVLEARFHNGIFQTSDPETIKELRRIMTKSGSCISEDREVFYAATMTPTQRANRGVILARKQEDEIRDLSSENSRLRKLLENAGVDSHPRRGKKLGEKTDSAAA